MALNEWCSSEFQLSQYPCSYVTVNWLLDNLFALMTTGYIPWSHGCHLQCSLLAFQKKSIWKPAEKVIGCWDKSSPVRMHPLFCICVMPAIFHPMHPLWPTQYLLYTHTSSSTYTIDHLQLVHCLLCTLWSAQHFLHAQVYPLYTVLLTSSPCTPAYPFASSPI